MEIEAHESAQRLMKDLRIEQAVVRRDFPNGIMIDVEEPRPIAMIACEYGFLDLDRRGVVVNAHRQMEGKKIPLLTGTTLRDCFIGDSVEQPLVDSTLMYLSYIRPDRLADITEVSLHDPEAVVARTVNSVEIVIGDLEPERLEEKAMYTQDFLVELQTTVHPMRKLDVRFAQPVVILRQ